MTREAFVHLLTADLPDRPGYFSRDAEINRTGAEAIDNLAPLQALSPAQVESLTSGNAPAAILLDTRPWIDFAAAHVPGSVHIALGGQYASWAAPVGLERSIVLLAEDEARLEESRLRLTRVGIERVEGYLEGGMEAWQRSGTPTEQVAQTSAGELAAALATGEHIQVLDVPPPIRMGGGPYRTSQVHSAVPFCRAAEPNAKSEEGLFAGLDRTQPVAVHCKGGYRSAIAASLLQRAGFQKVVNVLGGFDAWVAQTQAATVPSASTTSVPQPSSK